MKEAWQRKLISILVYKIKLLLIFTSHWLVCVEVSAPLYLSIVLKYLVVEVLELAGNVAQNNKEDRTTLCA